jgi:hypothetical protein
VCSLLALASGCGSQGLSHDPRLELGEPSPDRIEGRFRSSQGALELSATSSRPGVAEVELELAGQRFDARFDHEAGVVVLDGHDIGLERASHRALGEAAASLAAELDADSPLAARALYAAIVAWHESGGVPLPEQRFALRERAAHEGLGDKSLLDDGVTCLARGETYAVSFDYGDSTVVDEPVVADGWECNGLCGPYCTELTPWRMWTLDCLEHDQCCRATDTPDCWAPLGECGDEYQAAIADFLRGFDPFASHCGG